jgi:hypothetical protein
VTEGTGNLYFTEQRVIDTLGVATAGAQDVQLATFSADGDISVLLSDVFAEFSAGTGLSFDGGEYSLDATTSDVAEGTNLYFTDARARAAISVDAAGLNYDSSTGEIALTADSDDISEGSTNLYHTDARARAAISADNDPGNMASYDSATGEILVALSDFRKGFQNQSLTANTALNLTHNLGERLVHVSAMDGSGNKVDLEVVYTSSTVVQVKSTIALTGIDIAVSI